MSKQSIKEQNSKEIWFIFNLLEEAYTSLELNVTHVDQLINALNKIFSRDWMELEKEWKADLTDILTDNQKTELFLELFRTLCLFLGDLITSNRLILKDRLYIAFPLLLKLLFMLIQSFEEIFFEFQMPSINSKISSKLFGTILENLVEDIKEKGTYYWINEFYEPLLVEEKHRFKYDHSINCRKSQIIPFENIYFDHFPNILQSIELNAGISQFLSGYYPQESIDLRRQDYLSMAELIERMIPAMVQEFDEILIPLAMSYLELKSNVTIQPADFLITELFRMMADFFDLSQLHHKFRIRKENWKELLASKLVSSGLFSIALSANYDFRQAQPTVTNGFDRFIIAIIRTLCGFHEPGDIVSRQGSIMPEKFAFGNLPGTCSEILSILIRESDGHLATSPIYVNQKLDRAALATLFVMVTNGDKSFTDFGDSMGADAYRALLKVLTKYVSLEFLHGVSMIHFLFLFIVFEKKINNNFKPHTYSKILGGLKSTFANDTSHDEAQVEKIFFAHYEIFLPWIWRVCNSSWSLKEFVQSLMVKWLAFNFQNESLPDISVVISGKFDLNFPTQNQDRFIKVANLLFNDKFAMEVLLLIFACSNVEAEAFADIYLPFNIISSLTFYIVSLRYNNNHIQFNIDGFDSNMIFQNIVAFWGETIKHFIDSGAIENIPLQWWPRLNHTLMILGYRFDANKFDNISPLSRVLDHVLRLLESMDEIDVLFSDDITREQMYAIERFIYTINFLTILATLKGGKALLEIRQHPMILPALRDWISRKSQCLTEKKTGEWEILVQITSTILGLLNLAIPDDVNNRQEKFLFPSINELDGFLKIAKHENAIMAGHLCSFMKRGFDIKRDAFKANERCIYINIWIILRDLVISEIDNEYTWILLSPISESFQIIQRKCPPKLGPYLVENRWNFLMLRNLLRFSRYHILIESRETYGSISVLLRKRLLQGVFKMVEFFTISSPLWIQEILDSNTIDMMLYIVRQMIEQRDFEPQLFQALFRIFQELQQKVLLSTSAVKQIKVLLDDFIQKHEEFILTERIQKDENPHELISIRPRLNSHFLLIAPGVEKQSVSELAKSIKLAKELLAELEEKTVIDPAGYK
ncbi:hypothetical protein G9A89_018596 [Geosiphon pyriformis]|nr:hypothetical protein G9A89_018596 [Geosiphon pyriformis]